MLALPGSDLLALAEAASASDASNTDDSIGTDKDLLLVRVLTSPSTGMCLAAVAAHHLPLARENLVGDLTTGGRVLGLGTIQIHEVLLEAVDWLLGLCLEA